jgi:glucosylceramidase
MECTMQDSDRHLPRRDVNRRDFLKAGSATLGVAAALHGLPETVRAAEASPVGPIRVRQTAGANRYAELPALAWSPAGRAVPSSDVRLDPAKRYQQVLGLGGALTEGTTYTFQRLSPTDRSKIFHELFHPSEMNLNVGRTCIGSSDYATVAYSYDDSPTPDPELTKFSIEHDRQSVLPMLREIRAVNPDLFLLSTPWSPPGWMKDNNSPLGGTIRRRYLEAYAQYFVKFISAYAQEGISIDAVTSQNEVDTDQDGLMPACTWPQEIEVGFVGEHLGPAFEKAGIKTKIWLIDHNYNLWGRALASFEDNAVLKYADGVAWHGYLGKPTAMSRVQAAYPDKNAHWTEGGPDYRDKDYQTDWTRWVSEFSGIFRNWARSIIGWNLALDEMGRPTIGPFYSGGIVTIDSRTNAITRSGMYWALGHFSRHVKRGARVFDSTSMLTGVSHVAFENPDGSQVLVFANAGKTAASPRIVLGKSAARLTLPPDSVTTLEWKA